MLAASWNHRPEEEGITTPSSTASRAASSGWNHRPEEEGITTPSGLVAELLPGVGITALKKKGLRRRPSGGIRLSARWNHRPEEEGITTLNEPVLLASLVGITALKKKGLRHTGSHRMPQSFTLESPP